MAAPGSGGPSSKGSSFSSEVTKPNFLHKNLLPNCVVSQTKFHGLCPKDLSPFFGPDNQRQPKAVIGHKERLLLFDGWEARAQRWGTRPTEGVPRQAQATGHQTRLGAGLQTGRRHLTCPSTSTTAAGLCSKSFWKPLLLGPDVLASPHCHQPLHVVTTAASSLSRHRHLPQHPRGLTGCMARGREVLRTPGLSR